MTIDDRDPIVSCEELITVVNCAENIPKNIHLISYTGYIQFYLVLQI